VHDRATVNEDLLSRFEQEGGPVHRIYEPDAVCAVLGAGGKPASDLHLASLAADGVPFAFRRGGGGTVVLAPGQVVLALVTEVTSPFRNREYAAEINGWFVEALVSLGLRGAALEGISDLAIGGRKILGTSIYRRRLTLFYQASLLVQCDTALFTRYLAMPAKVPEYRRGRDHEEFCTTLCAEGFAGGTAEVIAALGKVVSARLPGLR
jgi:lipoate---protein ligase